jgi:hypothetical protein
MNPGSVNREPSLRKDRRSISHEKITRSVSRRSERQAQVFPAPLKLWKPIPSVLRYGTHPIDAALEQLDGSRSRMTASLCQLAEICRED